MVPRPHDGEKTQGLKIAKQSLLPMIYTPSPEEHYI